MSMFLNGEKLPQKSRKAMALPADSSTLPLVVRLGRYYYDDTPLLGKILDFNMWDRVLTDQEMSNYSQCGEEDYTATPPGNLINQDTLWNITGTLIKKIDLTPDQIDCKSRYEKSKTGLFQGPIYFQRRLDSIFCPNSQHKIMS